MFYELAQQLLRQWQNNTLRAQRLLAPEPWPLRLAIGKPTATQVLLLGLQQRKKADWSKGQASLILQSNNL
ncbi:DUF3322 domain-containing protein [Denitrificimonas caeni]|uniref:DUF3322 domain-containing protein n=1 Tax=Denitrificimonas caeni TaxID=521720 RepID=UPI003B3AD1BC